MESVKGSAKWWYGVNPYVAAASIIWILSVILLYASGEEGREIVAWVMAGPACIFYCWFSLTRLIPESGTVAPRFWIYLKNSVFVLLATYVPMTLLAYLMVMDAEVAAGMAMVVSGFVILFGMPLSWLLYRYKINTDKTIRLLKTELGQSNAHFDFLRSQINPHFLFNSLNTIYGLALHENAVHTSTAVEKLSGMMRFMLRENMEAFIPLNREIEYLQNYVSLQRLRFGSHPSVTIDVYIDEAEVAGQIAPMLLIPFVENAFKHGISYKEPSYIRISMQILNDQIEFDVANSKHERTGAEKPSDETGGIGIENTKQRLQLLYGEKQELVIRESVRDYFVHLTVPVVL